MATPRKVKKPIAQTTDAIGSRIEPVDKLESYLAGMVYGRSGTGKTTFAATFPKPMLLLDIREKGTDSISNVEGVDRIEVQDWDDIESIYWYVKNGKGKKYKTVAIDQVSQMQELALIEALAIRNKSPGDQISKADFGVAAGLMKTWILNYRDLIDEEKHVLLISHDRITGTDEDGDEGQIDPSVGPRLMPSLASFVNGAVKFIGHTYIRESFDLKGGKRKREVAWAMRLGPHSSYTTKIRSPVGSPVPGSIDNPTFDKLVAIMRGEYSEATESTKPKLRRRV